jgi:phosphohistidine phosphatase SixA
VRQVKDCLPEIRILIGLLHQQVKKRSKMSLPHLGMFDYVITSPLRRAHQTAATVSKTLRVAKKIETWNELKPEGNRLEMYKNCHS